MPRLARVMERWRPVAGFEGTYEVSDIGRVRSLDRTVRYLNGNVRTYVGRLRKTRLISGYPGLDLKLNGKRVTVQIHPLVAAAFIGPRPSGKQVAHRDGNCLNGVLSNLRYATPVDNDADKIAHGTRPNGEKNGQSKLMRAQIAEIKERSASGERQRSIADSLGINQSTVSRIVASQRWGHL